MVGLSCQQEAVAESANSKAIGKTEHALPKAHAEQAKAHGISKARKKRPKKQHSEERRNNSDLLCDADAIVLSEEECVDVVGKSSSYQEFENDISGEATSTSTIQLQIQLYDARSSLLPVMMSPGSWWSRRNLLHKSSPVHRKKNTTSETLARFIEERAKGLCVPVPVIVNSKIFKKTEETTSGASARLTIHEQSLSILSNQSFWPKPAYVRKWKFKEQPPAAPGIV